MSKSRHMVIPRTMSFVFYEDQMLLIRASSEKKWEGVSSPVGGHIEQGEDVIESAEREILEETGLELPNTELVGVVHAVNFYGNNIMLFVTVSQSEIKEVVQNHREGELFWVKVSDLKSIELHPDVEPILEYILRHPGRLFTGNSEFNDQNELTSLNILGSKVDPS